MDINKIKQVKSEIEGLILEAKQRALKEGMSLNSPVFVKKINDVRTKLLKKFGISQEEYDNVEKASFQEDVSGKIKSKRQIKQEIKETLEEENLKKYQAEKIAAYGVSISKMQREIISTIIAIGKFNGRVDAIKPFNQDEIKELEPSQIKGYLNDRRSVEKQFKEFVKSINQANKTFHEYEKEWNDLSKRIEKIEKTDFTLNHSDLKNIGPNDHHDELHTLESHIESDLMKKLLYIVSPAFTKQFYDHMNGLQSGVIDIGGITKNDADSYYGTITLTFIVDGGGDVITTGIKGDLEIPFACTIVGVTMLADVAGSIEVDIWKNNYASFPPLVANSIVGATPPTISADIKSQDESIVDWTPNLTAGDILRFNVNSASTIKRVTISLKVSRAVTYG